MQALGSMRLVNSQILDPDLASTLPCSHPASRFNCHTLSCKVSLDQFPQTCNSFYISKADPPRCESVAQLPCRIEREATIPLPVSWVQGK